MALRRVFVERVEDGAAVAKGSAAHHLARVARLRPGERVEVSDQARAYRAVTERCTPREVRFRIEEPLPPPAPAPELDVGLSIIRFRRFEWAVEKLTELGVNSVTPVAADRSDAALRAASIKRVARWRRIALEAAQQSRRLAAPLVRTPVGLDEFTGRCTAPLRLLAQPGAPRFAAAGMDGGTAFLVGPEGGWTRTERQVAAEHGFEPVALGANVLRSETAALALATICCHRSGRADPQ
ncbi:MAG: RsmE family RNA methyltransferase [Bryobacterales bacterium]|nr:RsmE family RNA methyltransferase [Bryobacterales bacterium]MDE0628773.1 RsmE family RNA methyltransferase [Bryobacterales bacterium]